MSNSSNGSAFTVAELCEASADGDVERINTILAVASHLVGVDTASYDEHRALHHAVINRHAEAVTALMAAGADPNQGVYPHRTASTPLVMARDRGFNDIIEVINGELERRREANLCPNLTVSPDVVLLAEMVAAGDVEGAIRDIHKSPELVDACDEHGDTVLHHASRHGHPGLVQALLQLNADTGKTNLEERSPLELAVEHTATTDRRLAEGCFMAAGILMTAGAPRSLRTNVMLGDIEAVRQIAESHPTLFEPNIESESHLLENAVRHNRYDMVKLLLDLGMDPDQRYRISSLEEETYNWGEPLWIAAGDGMYEIAQLILERGADPNAAVYASGDPMSRAYNNRDDRMKRLLYRYGGSMTPEGAALECDTSAAVMALKLKPELVEGILWGAACGGDPSVVGVCLPRIDWASDDPRWYGLIIQPIRIWPCNPHRKFREFDRSVFPEMVRMILDHGVDPNVKGRRDTSLLHYIAATGKIWGEPVLRDDERAAFARMFLEYGALLDARDTLLHSTPLAWAARWGRRELVELYLQHGADPQPDGESWTTPLAWAERYGHASVDNRLREAGAVS